MRRCFAFSDPEYVAVVAVLRRGFGGQSGCFEICERAAVQIVYPDVGRETRRKSGIDLPVHCAESRSALSDSL